MNRDAMKDMLLRMADDVLILAHRHSEWTGLGPLLEEDIAFSSIAQDKLGHAQALFSILHEHFEGAEPDAMAFGRTEQLMRCCHLVELPNGEYDFSLMRHFLFDAAEYVRWTALCESSFEPLAKLALKIRGELKYHLYHAQTWVIQLGAEGSEESKARMQTALRNVWPFALGIFEVRPGDADLVSDGVFPGEDVLRERWIAFVSNVFEKAKLEIPVDASAVLGGRDGYHTEHLGPLLDEMTEVYRQDPSAQW
ncbi:MAG: phenylacetate-CoA oxygenase subunit PaaC [Candidatus Kapabacteria bacterium]|nr:phenylacetate-CoA oxygenase subunit PaaC [Candidatus Kapabacteria bacterium]